MPWLEFHAAEIKKLQKFRDFRVELNWSVNEALGFLGNFWGEVVILREDGDIRSWRPDYIVELTQVKTPPERLWAALTAADRWVDVKEDGRVLVHDWLDYAGPFLKSKYRRSKLRLLMDIWALHGREYKLSKKEAQDLAEQDAAGEEGIKTAARLQPGYSQAKTCNRTVPYQTEPTTKTAPSAVDLTRAMAERSERRLLQSRAATAGLPFSYGQAPDRFEKGVAIMNLPEQTIKSILSTMPRLGADLTAMLMEVLEMKRLEKVR